MNWNSTEFVWLDWTVLAIGVIGVIWAVWHAIVKDRKAQKGEDSSAYLFGKGEPWYVIGMAIFAANIGSEHLVGLAGTGAKSGVGMAHWEMQGWMILILGWLFVPFYQLLINKMGKIITMPDFLKFRYTQRTGSWLSIITLVAYILTKVSVTALTGGIFFEYLWGLNFWVGAIGLIILTTIFTVFGGMKGVMTLSTIQTPILVIGSFLVLFLGLSTLGGGSISAGWADMMDYCGKLNNGYGTTHMFHWEAGDSMYQEYPGFVVFIGATIIGIKGRVAFEAAAPKLIIEAHRLLEKSTLSKWQQYWKDQVGNWYGMFLHESQYLEPVMPDIEAMLTSSQRNVNGTAILKLRPYSFQTVGVDSPDDLTKSKLGEYGEMQHGWTAEDAKGFIKVSSTPLRVYYGMHPDEQR